MVFLSQNNLTLPICYWTVNDRKKNLLLILVQCNEEMSTDLQCTYRITFKNSRNQKEWGEKNTDTCQTNRPGETAWSDLCLYISAVSNCNSWMVFSLVKIKRIAYEFLERGLERKGKNETKDETKEKKWTKHARIESMKVKDHDQCGLQENAREGHYRNFV